MLSSFKPKSLKMIRRLLARFLISRLSLKKNLHTTRATMLLTKLKIYVVLLSTSKVKTMRLLRIKLIMTKAKVIVPYLIPKVRGTEATNRT